MRVALFGGTFDPPHCGHIAVAKAAADAFALDRVLFAPTGLQPLKLEAARAPFSTRLDLTAAACEEDPRFFVTDIDGPRSNHSPNYTVDTLTNFAARYPSDTRFYLVGADSFLSFRRWRESERLLELAEWIVVSRPGYSLNEENLVPLALTTTQRARVQILTEVAENISATDLRERIHKGDWCVDLLPRPVAAYIAKHHLYR